MGLFTFSLSAQTTSNIEQRTSINDDGSAPHSSAILDVQSTDKGMLVPRMTSVQRQAITTPATGLLVFDTNTSSFWLYNGTVWTDLAPLNQLVDADSDTKVQVEESADEDIIRFDLAGTEQWVMTGTRLEAMNTGNSVFIGQDAGLNDDLTDNQNVFVGDEAGEENTTGYDNTAIGYQALNSNTSGIQNTAIGLQALSNNTTGLNNTATGFNALLFNTTGFNNTANGFNSLLFNETGNNNTSFGRDALATNITGSENTAVGYFALWNNTTGSNNTAVGNSANVTSGALTNATAIGNGASVDASNKVRIGNGSVTSNGGQVIWTAFSDARIKDQVKDNVPGIEFIKELRPVTYHYNVDKQNELMGIENESRKESDYEIEKIAFTGFLAQEVDAAAEKINYDFSGVDKSGDILGIRYSSFVMPLVKGMQEQQEQIETLQGQILNRDDRISSLEERLESLAQQMEKLKLDSQ